MLVGAETFARNGDDVSFMQQAAGNVGC